MQLGQKVASTKSLPPEHKPLAQARGFLAFPLIVFSYPRSVIPVLYPGGHPRERPPSKCT